MKTGVGINMLVLILLVMSINGGAVVPIYNASDQSKDYVPYQKLNDKEGSQNERECNFFSGKWVIDSSYPLYDASECPYIQTQINCRPNGRPDSDYEKWRWQADACSIPRFNANAMLERLRGKRLVFVGDSIIRGQFQSMLCLLQGVIPNDKKSIVEQSLVTTFKALDYNASVELFWAPFLVELETNNEGKKILHLDSIEEYGTYWKGADILVFESSHWWNSRGRGKGRRWDIIMEGNKTYSNIDPMVAYRKALTTWANWANSLIDIKSLTMFFMGMAPRHFGCKKETQPTQITSSYNSSLPQVPILKQVLSSTKFPVILMDITDMSMLRKDAHPSVYGSPTPQLGDDGDCSHWCLPGVPDSWNELLYASFTLGKK